MLKALSDTVQFGAPELFATSIVTACESFAELEEVHALSFSRRKPVHHAHGANRCRQIQEAHDSPKLTHRQP